MKFKLLKVINGYESKLFEFGEKTEIHSDINSVGKSTLLRLLFYAMGYPIPSTKKIRFSKLQTKLVLETEKEIILSRRDNNISLEIEGVTENLELPRDLYYILGKVFETSNINVLESLLGCIYLDQDKGWTLLNRGTVIGGIKFKVETLIEGISEKDIANLKIEVEKITSELKRLKELQKIVLFQSENFNLMEQSNFQSNKSSDIEKDILIVRSNKNELLKKLSTLKELATKNEGYLSYIESLGLSVRCSTGEIVELSRDNILGFDDIQKIIDLRIFHLNQEIDKLSKREIELKQEIENSQYLVRVENPIKLFEQRLQLIVAPREIIEDEIRRLKQRKKELENYIKISLRDDTNQNLFDNILKFATKLGVEEYLNIDKNFVFTSDLKSLSGTVLHKLVFCYKMAYITEIQKYLGITLPIVLDSPSGREVDQKNIEDMFNILNTDFRYNQIIIASIFKYSEFDADKLIDIQESLLEQ
ncbi:hypothetical protein [Streptococcus oralis]|uniref:hypothetical protein n=1 Tax=Streptococcus oralis TaxID=1303 RepID=UPI0022842767|nr:hypothetical protein [Streptococcus oralis]MCY7112872.1 hypothetical protein [Streptococcus oralis]